MYYVLNEIVNVYVFMFGFLIMINVLLISKYICILSKFLIIIKYMNNVILCYKYYLIYKLNLL